MRNSAAFLSHIVFAATLGLSSIAAHAVSLSGVVIGSNVYTVTFTQDSDGGTTFNDVFGVGSPTLTFTTQADASAAATAVRDAGIAAGFDYTPNGTFNVFALPFGFSVTEFSYFTGWSSVAGETQEFNGVFGPFTTLRTSTLVASFATFQLAGQAVPEPGTLALLGLGLLGLGLTRRKAA